MSLNLHRSLLRIAARAVAVAVLMLGSSAVTAPDAAAQNPMAILRETANYRLTNANLNKFSQVVRNLAQLRRQHPNLEFGVEVERAESVSDIARALDRQPLVRSAIHRGGMTSREFVLFTFAMAAAAMFSQMEQHPQAQVQGLPVQPNRENIAFYRANRARLDALSRELDFGPDLGRGGQHRHR